MTERSQYDVYIAHGQGEQAFAERLREDLRLASLRVWPNSGYTEAALIESSLIVTLQVGAATPESVKHTLKLVRRSGNVHPIIQIIVEGNQFILRHIGQDEVYDTYGKGLVQLVEVIRSALKKSQMNLIRVTNPIVEEVDPVQWLAALARRQGAAESDLQGLPMTDEPPSVFILHSAAMSDVDAAEIIRRDLAAEGLSVMTIDDLAEATGDKRELISVALADMRAVVLLTSQHAMSSARVEYALHRIVEQELPLISVRIYQDEESTGSPPIDIDMSGPNYEPGLFRLSRILSQYTGIQTRAAEMQAAPLTATAQAQVQPPAPPGTSFFPGSPKTPTPDEAVSREAPAVDAAEFAAYYPKEAAPGTWYTLVAYMYRVFASQEVAADVKRQLEAQLDDFRRTDVNSQLPDGVLVTVRPNLPGFQFNPPELQIGFYQDWHRLLFEIRSDDNEALLEQAANGVLTFSVEGVIVADVPVSIFLTNSPDQQAETMSSATMPYKSIFCSYSRDDTQVVERVERVYRALGLEYLRDVATLRSGQNWSEELLRLIDRADIFQLFWSETAAASQYVRQEWEYALSLDRTDEAFIRPVYWKKPLPPVPDALSHLHFAFEPELDD